MNPYAVVKYHLVMRGINMKRDDPRLADYLEIMEAEAHHDHEIIEDENGYSRIYPYNA